MSQVWGVMDTDYIPKREDVCARCRRPGIMCDIIASSCDADLDIKYDYWYGRTKKAMDTLRRLPTDALKDYLPEERRTPTELKAVILDELQAREKEDTPRL